MTTPVRIFEEIDAKLNEIIELLKPKAKAAVEEWEDVTGECTYLPPASGHDVGAITYNHGNILHGFFSNYRLRKIDGMHCGPAFVVERRKSQCAGHCDLPLGHPGEHQRKGKS